MSATGMPSAPCLRMNAFWASENREAFIALHSSQPGESAPKTLTKNGPVLRTQSSRLHRRRAWGDVAVVHNQQQRVGGATHVCSTPQLLHCFVRDNERGVLQGKRRHRSRRSRKMLVYLLEQKL